MTDTPVLIVCRKCGRPQPRGNFHNNAGRPAGHHPWCKACRRIVEGAYKQKDIVRSREIQRDRTLRSKYGIAANEYDDMLDEQRGVCAACRNPERTYDPRWRRTRRLAVDHCHATGRVRGLLCGPCNRALGLLEDSEDRLYALIAYLRSSTDGHSVRARGDS